MIEVHNSSVEEDKEKVIQGVVLNGVEREGRGGGLLGRVLLVRRVVARASECVSRV